MAYVQIKSEERKAHEEMILKSFGTSSQQATAEQRECAERIAYETQKLLRTEVPADDY